VSFLSLDIVFKEEILRENLSRPFRLLCQHFIDAIKSSQFFSSHVPLFIYVQLSYFVRKRKRERERERERKKNYRRDDNEWWK
jgi:hypothetical protein